MAKAVDKAYQTVRDRIVRGVYPAASRITEQEVAAVAGVSRTPVREALRKLHAEGLLEFVPHQGAVVTEWTSEDRDDVFELRALLESYGAARAARRMTDQGLAELRRLAEEQYHETLSKADGYLERCGDLNSQFHRRIHEFAGSSRLVSALASLIEAPLMMKTFAAYQDEDLIRSASHHLEIVRALETRDSDWSAALMRSHVLGARGALRSL
ncbi:MAG: GntR family transcriptional regulator [Steroidobacteraceae bacterium]|jgi:DNA-binding GntR family transcriptional regulator|nr:GntR family transcriptional regulator [Steroidobacteraceae bacterium]